RELTKEIMDLLKERKITDKKIVIGGIIPEDDIGTLKDMGISDVFTPGTSLEDIYNRVQGL
ncbi:MAG: methylmalonyl-CoA mutase, partial [Actinomycetia bacterium]|nr:methylmalonyl-CoA mutase [Actinomycetes bacterium]